MKQFRIRDLLWLMLLVAVCLTWWLDRQRLSNRLATFEILKTHTTLLDSMPEALEEIEHELNAEQGKTTSN